MLIVRRILTNEGTLYGNSPSEIAEYLERQLNTFEAEGLKVCGVVALPDYHNLSGDGGVKDIIILCEDIPHERKDWHATPISNDNTTMHGMDTSDITARLQSAILSWPQAVQFVVALTDHHDFVQHCGLDGLKTFILCY